MRSRPDCCGSCGLPKGCCHCGLKTAAVVGVVVAAVVVVVVGTYRMDVGRQVWVFVALVNDSERGWL